MANVYVYSGAGGAGTGADWANAYTTLAAAATAKAAGDIFWVADDHAETAAASTTITFPGTASAPNYCYCVLRSGGSVPPVAADLRTTGSVARTGASNITIRGNFYLYGLTFSAGSAGNAGLILFNTTSGQQSAIQACALVLNNTSTSSSIQIGGGPGNISSVRWLNTTAQFGAVQQAINLADDGGQFRWENTATALAGATIPTTLFTYGASGQQVVLDGVDLSAAGSGKTLFGADSSACAGVQINNCKLGGSVTVSSTPARPNYPSRDVCISDSGDTGYRQERYQYTGTLTTETTYTRVGGATDPAGNLISWKVVTTANAKDIQPFRCFSIGKWNATTGSSVTAVVEIESASTLTNNDVLMEVEYLGTSGFPLSSRATSSAGITPLTTASNLATSSATWNGALGSAVKQYMTISFTPQEAGFVRVVVCVGKASQTLYIDPVVTLS